MNQNLTTDSFYAMGTLYEVTIAGQNEEYCHQASQTVFEEIKHMEQLFSRFNPCSQIGQINQLIPGQSLNINIEVFECLETANRIKNQTNGAFEINKAVLEHHKKKPFYAKSLMKSKSKAPRFELSNSNNEFLFTIPNSEYQKSSKVIDLDLGGIGKGYALDKAIEILNDWDIDNALIHGGTSTVRARGTPEKNANGWQINVASNGNLSPYQKTIFLKDRSLSCSGTEVKGNHIIDPRTGNPATEHLAAWVSHPVSSISDALSTAFMVMNRNEINTYCNNHPEVWAMVITKSQDCEILNSDIFN
ncbi:MAG: FAD:protein FMN transferase [Candidatus Aminicenantaceae bacterium]